MFHQTQDFIKMTIFDHLKNITTQKGEFLGEEGWNNWMVNRYLSMDQDYCEVVNLVQKNTWRIKPEHLYNLYKDIIPQQYIYLKYIKAKKKVDYKKDEIEAIKQYFEVSEREAKEYINMLPKNELKEIMSQINGK